MTTRTNFNNLPTEILSQIIAYDEEDSVTLDSAQRVSKAWQLAFSRRCNSMLCEDLNKLPQPFQAELRDVMKKHPYIQQILDRLDLEKRPHPVSPKELNLQKEPYVVSPEELRSVLKTLCCKSFTLNWYKVAIHILGNKHARRPFALSLADSSTALLLLKQNRHLWSALPRELKRNEKIRDAVLNQCTFDDQTLLHAIGKAAARKAPFERNFETPREEAPRQKSTDEEALNPANPPKTPEEQIMKPSRVPRPLFLGF